jgi:ferredoxin
LQKAPEVRDEEGMPMRVIVNSDLCEANGVCAGAAPGVFTLDEEEHLHIAGPEVPPGLADAVERAVSGCPKRALRLES